MCCGIHRRRDCKSCIITKRRKLICVERRRRNEKTRERERERGYKETTGGVLTFVNAVIVNVVIVIIAVVVAVVAVVSACAMCVQKGAAVMKL